MTPLIAGGGTDGKANGTSAAVRFLARQLGIAELTNWQVRLPVAAGNDEYDVTDASYDVTRDSDALKAVLSGDAAAIARDFEHLRETYPVRREL
ncbi:MAG: hypothetical protein J6X77_04330 [Bacteroidales bacterium]|nr:hypothetical protein [Bacteroidales bacterium]